MQDACQAPPLFDAGLYLASNPDLRRAFDAGLIGDALEHWAARGEAETRSGMRPTLLGLAPVDDPEPGPAALAGAAGLAIEWYFALNPGLADALGHDPARARRHWLLHGATEGRAGFGASPSWAREADRGRDRSDLPPGCDLFVDADPDGGPEAVLGRRALAALRKAGIAVSVRAWTRRRGRLVLAREELDRGPTYRDAILAASPSGMRLLLASIGPAQFARRRLIGLVGSAPLAPYAADWPVLACLDALLVAGAGPARRARACSPAPVQAVAVDPAPLLDRATARRLLGLPRDGTVTLLGAGATRGSGICIRDAQQRPTVDGEPSSTTGSDQRVLDDARDPWSGASLLLAAVDRWCPGPDLNEADRADARGAGITIDPGDDLPVDEGDALPLAQVLGCLLGAEPRVAGRRPASLVPAPPGVPGGGGAPIVLTLLIDVRGSARAERDALIAHLLALGVAPTELCLAVGDTGAGGRRDPRVRVARDLRTASAVATGEWIVPLTVAAGFRLEAAAVAAVAARCAAPDRPDVLIALASGTEDEGDDEAVRSGFATPLLDRIETMITQPIAIARMRWQCSAAETSGFGAAMPYAALLAAVRAGARIGALAVASGIDPFGVDEREDPALAEAGRRALRRHLRLSGRGGDTVGRDRAPGLFRVRRPDRSGAVAPLALIGPALPTADADVPGEQRHEADTLAALGACLASVTAELVLLVGHAPDRAGNDAPCSPRHPDPSDLARLRDAVEYGGAGAARIVAAPSWLLTRRTVLLAATAALDDTDGVRALRPDGLAVMTRRIAALGERVSVLA